MRHGHWPLRENNLRQSDRLPIVGKREVFSHLIAEFRRWIDTNPFAASFGNHTFRRTPFAFALNIAVIAVSQIS